jgi:hypothetical protein
MELVGQWAFGGSEHDDTSVAEKEVWGRAQ